MKFSKFCVRQKAAGNGEEEEEEEEAKNYRQDMRKTPRWLGGNAKACVPRFGFVTAYSKFPNFQISTVGSR